MARRSATLRLVSTFSVHLDPRGTGHDDVIVGIAGHELRSDSYYLRLDPSLWPDREDTTKARAVLRVLLERLLAAVRELDEGGAAYLAHDVSDEYTGWLQLRREGGDIALMSGYSSAHGHTMTPSEDGVTTEPPADLHPLHVDYPRIPHDALLAQLATSLAALTD